MHDNDRHCTSSEQENWEEVVGVLKDQILKKLKNPKLRLNELIVLTELTGVAMDLGVNSKNFDGMRESFKAKLERRRSI